MPRLHNIPELRTTRRRLRGLPTRSEAALWKALRRRQLHGRRFRRQHSIGRYVVDVYCPAERLAIELDGAVHRDPARADYDAERQRWLEAQGLRILRFSNDDVESQLDLVLDAIAAAFLPHDEMVTRGHVVDLVSLPPRSGGRAGEGGQPGQSSAAERAPLPPAPSPESGEGESSDRP